MTNIVWSKNGVLAYARGPRVYITWPERRDGACWSLMDPQEINVGREVAFLSFGPHHDLAVVDETGRIEVIEILSGGRYKVKVPWLSVADPRARPAELDKIVRVCWLNNDKSLGLPTSVPKKVPPGPPGQPQPSMKAVWDSIKPSGPLHPIHGKTCLLAVTGNGMLRIISEGDDFKEVSVPLPTRAVVRAAAFTSAGPDTLMMAAYCESQVMLFEVRIVFEGAAVASTHIKPIAAAAVTEPLDGELSVFEIIKSPAMPQVRPIVHAIFNTGDSSQVLIFKLSPWTEKLHPSFARAAPPVERSKLFLSDSRTTSKAIKAYYTTRTAIIIIYRDLSIESQNLISVPMLLPGRDLQFALGAGEFCFSPNMCMVAQMSEKSGELPTLHTLTCKITHPEKLAELPTLIATSYAFSVYNYIHCDDLLALVRRWIDVDLPQRNQNMNISAFTAMLSTESQRLLNVPFDPIDGQADKFIVIPSSLQRWLMLQMELGTAKNWTKTPSSLMAWMGLNIQYLAFVTKFTLRSIAPKQRDTPLPPPQQLAQIALHCYHINCMLGQLRWFTDLVAHLTKEVFLGTVQPGASAEKMDPKKDPAVQWLARNAGSFVNVLLSKIMRWLLIFIIRGVKGIETLLVHLSNQERQLNSTFGVAQLTHKRFQGITSGIISMDAFDGILKEIDKRLQTLYNNDQIQDRVKQALELELLKNQQTPTQLLPVVSQIVLLFRRLLSTVEIPSLYFYDTSWLLLDEHQLTGRDKIDAIKKFVIKSTSKLRVCTRCGQPSAIETPRQQQLNQVGSLFNRNCLCGGLWKDV